MRAKLHKILITGGAGFIGSEFTRQAVKKGFKIIVVDKLTYAGDLRRLKEVSGKYKFYKTDISDKNKIETIFKQEKPNVVLNFAAETHVDRSIKDASPFIDTNVKGTQVLLDISKKYDIGKFIHISCYDEKTKALTTKGLKTYEELRVGDKVFSLNPLNQEVEIKPVEKVIIQHYKGKMFHFKNKRIDLLVTPNHKMFIINTSKKNKKLLIETAEKASRRSIFYLPEGHWVGRENKEHFHIEGHGLVKTEDLMYILGIFIGDGFIAYQEKEVETKSGLNRKNFLKNCRDDFTGRFKKIEKQCDYKTKRCGYRIFFDIPENDKCRKKVEETLSNLGIKYHSHKGKAGTHLYFTSKVFMEFFAQCGHGAYNKHIPQWALNYSPTYLKHLLKGLLDSDGSRGVIYHTVSKKLVSDICELCIKLNLKPSIHKRHAKSFLCSRKIESDAYYIFIANTQKSIIRQRNKIIDYNGKIWCLKIKDNKNFLVERNGKLDFCGNTDEVYGEIRKGKFTEQSPLKPNSPYAASKAAADLLLKSYIRTYSFPGIIVRLSNNYGPWQYPEKLIPLAILKALKNKKIPLYAQGKNIREWLYVQDAVCAILEVLKKGKKGEIYNIGSNQEKQNITVIRDILRILNKKEELIQFVKDRPGHDIRYKLNSRKISKETGWKPLVNFEQGLRDTVNWYIKHNT